MFREGRVDGDGLCPYHGETVLAVVAGTAMWAIGVREARAFVSREGKDIGSWREVVRNKGALRRR